VINPHPTAVVADVGVLLNTALPGPPTFLYQTLDGTGISVVGNPNTPTTIPPGGTKFFLLALTPPAVVPPTQMNFLFQGFDTIAAPIISSVDTLLFSAALTQPPDVIAIAATCPNAAAPPLTVNIPGSNSSAGFTMAAVNLGTAGNITVTPNTGSANLPVTLTVCRTNLQTGLCEQPLVPQSSVTTLLGTNEVATFNVFAQGTGQTISFDPAVTRIFVPFAEEVGGAIRGLTSVGVQTHSPICL
jgi:hypothetical protein